MRIKDGRIDLLNKNDFLSIVKKSKSIKEALLFLNLTPNGTQYVKFKNRCLKEKISIDHFYEYQKERAKSLVNFNKIDSSVYFVKNKYVDSKTLKSKIRSEKKLEEKCQECGITDVWNNQPLVLHLDHVDGDNKNNLISNLRFLCPNCHSQTKTYSGRNRKIK